MAATGSQIRRLAADVAARSQAPAQALAEQKSALGLARLGMFAMPTLIVVVLALTATLAVSVVRTGGFLGLGGYTALGVVALVGAILMNAVWLRAPRLNGLPVSRKSAPELHAIVHEAALELAAPEPNSIVVTDQLAVTLHQVPRLGLLAGTAGVLEIGLPALQAYSRSELGVLITLELARFSSARDLQERNVERMADLWTGVTKPAARAAFSMDFIAGIFAGWVAPRIAQASRFARAKSVLAADRAAADLIGATDTGLALQRRVVAVAFLDEYWHRLAEEPITTPTPNLLPYREMGNFMPRIGEWEQAETALRLALVNRVQEPGSEPPLWQRLKSLAVRPMMPPIVHDSATVLLGTMYEKAVGHFDRSWQRANARAWAKAYAVAKASGALTAQAVEESMTVPAAANYQQADYEQHAAISQAPVQAEAYGHFDSEADLFQPAEEAMPANMISPADPVDRAAEFEPIAQVEPQIEAAAETELPSIADAIAIAQQAELDGGFELARDRYVDACESYPDNGRTWLAYAVALLRAGSEDAVECIEQTLALAPTTAWELEDGQSWFDIGYALLEADDEGGVVCLEQAIMIDESLTDEAMHLADQFADRTAPDLQSISVEPIHRQPTAMAS